VGAAHEPELAPVLCGNLAALELAQRLDELVDVVFFGKGGARAPGVCLVKGRHSSPRHPQRPIPRTVKVRAALRRPELPGPAPLPPPPALPPPRSEPPHLPS